jgi:hypothetical protein
MSESNRRKKVFNLTRGYLGNNNEKELNLALNLGEFKGPICDFIGFSQHKGECWNDTLQEIFLFTDGLKEITQSLIYNLDTSYDVLSELVSSRLYPGDELNTEKLNTVNKLVKYITLMKVRFVTHYNFLNTSRNENKKHLLEKIHTKKRRLSAACAIGSAKSIINLHKGNSNVYVPGLAIKYRNDLLLNLFKIFDIGFIVSDYKETDTVSSSNAFIVSAYILDYVNTNTYKLDDDDDGLHTFGFLKCDSIWKIYDDNRKRFVIINELLIDLFIKENNIVLGVDTNDNVFIMKYNKNNKSNKDLSVYIKEYYDIDTKSWRGWSAEWDTLHSFKVIFIKGIVSTVRRRVRLGALRRGGKQSSNKQSDKRSGKPGGKTRKKLKRLSKN